MRNNHNHQPASEKIAEQNETALWSRISDQLGKAVSDKKNILLSRLFGDKQSTPGLIDVLAGSLYIMQDRINRSRMAGDPPDIILSPRLSHLGLMEYDRGTEAIAEGHACVERMRSALEHVVTG